MPTIEDYSDPEDMDLDLSSVPPPASSAAAKGKGPALPADLLGPEAGIPKALWVQPDASLGRPPHNDWTRWDTLYPLYIDAKRPQQDGGRRVNAKLALQWPLAEQMAKACRALGFEAVFEPSKTHPKDWENPGRVKVHLKSEDGKPRNPAIKNKRILLARICALLGPIQPHAPAPTEDNPHPLPPIHLRLPANSPAISHGTLDQAMKGGGLGGMLGGMFGGGEDDEAIEKAKRDKEEEDRKKREQMQKMLKPKKVHIKRRR
ncbi:signal recognition particle subunit SRP19 [Rhodotorula toruloides]|uniref:BY PROTMAP: gi/472586754/gb/EMS24273.1/ signal recognition particle subunit SRP19 [Rhodosporidium toruloides NP11] gi/647398167/emb/CDR41797.1/ RHTO0S06e06502g1_1 [Rhodosporidium toruloides] n=1 Tax=Rhodotorula toruloides TaxID=5286 RepID=A0A0K3CB61_RHOTO|nr:signal recognition particle subunit SRP19 [Rhodotorula toruloides]PRQ76231.1 Signal recognition particle, SRP19 subunit [Rhodotorula toruloides]